MTVSSRIPAVIDALVTVFTTAVAPAVVYDGPVVTGDAPLSFLYVGYNGDPEGQMYAGGSEPNWAGLGAKKQNEPVNVQCVAVSRGNETTWKTVRDATFALITSVETALIGDPSIGLSPPTTAELNTMQYFQASDGSFMEGRVVFTVLVNTRI